MVLYRKYRPQTLDDLDGQTTVKQNLKSAITSGKMAHAYLFCGPRGTGKTSTARILAKMVNCQRSDVGSQISDRKAPNLPCNECPSCLSITDGSNLDVIEMDAASNRGIEDIRTLREGIKLSPTSCKKKVYIIDEVHMLTGEAFNALLKTLEEPPSHVLFILATTEVHKVPQTIISRVQKLEFKLASQEELLGSLKRIAQKDAIEIEDEALVSLAKYAQGSFRDAHKLLDQLAGFGKITQKTVEENLGLSSLGQVLEILKDISKGDAKKALLSLEKLLQTGVNIRELNLSILDILRMCLLIKNGLGDQLVKKELEEEDFKMLKEITIGFTGERLLLTINSFQKSLEESRFVSIPSLPVEVAVVESCQEVDSSQLTVHGKKPQEEDVGNQTIPEVATHEKLPISSEPTNELTENHSSDIQKIKEKWVYVLETVKQYNFSLEALLRSSEIVECDEKNVILEVPYSFHQRILEAPKSRDPLESLFADILGRSVRVSTILGKRKVNKEELSNVEVAADDEIVRMAAEIFSSDSVN